MHHLDAPWKPAEVEQRDGRILRQGNSNAEVAVYRYVTEGSFDSYMWQALETKARFISQVMTGEAAVRRAEDVGGQELSYAEVKAIASGNPAVLVLAEADAELQRLAVLRRNYADEQFIARRKLKELPEQIERLEQRLKCLAADHRTVAGADPTALVVGNRSVSLPDSPAALTRVLERLPETADRKFPLGTYRDLSFGIEFRWNNADVYLTGETELRTPLAKESRGARAVLNALNRVVDSYDVRIEANTKELELARHQLHDYEARLGRPFGHAAYLDALTGLRDRLKVALSGTPAEGEPTAAELSERIRALKASHHIEAAPVRVRDKPRIEIVRRREEPPHVAAPEAPAATVPETKPVDGTPEDEDTTPGAFRERVRRSVQGRLF